MQNQVDANEMDTDNYYLVISVDIFLDIVRYEKKKPSLSQKMFKSYQYLSTSWKAWKPRE